MCPFPGRNGCLPLNSLETKILKESNKGRARKTIAKKGPLFGKLMKLVLIPERIRLIAKIESINPINSDPVSPINILAG